MFGWLAHTLAAVCPHAFAPSCQPRWLRIAPASLASRLPLLGTVLYLPMRSDGSPDHPARGWLAESEDLAPLLHTRWLLASCVIGADGPREWLECVDAAGRLRARLHLLPDTDYLAWDVLLCAATPEDAPVFQRVQRPFRAAGARLLHFTQRRLGQMDVLGGRDAARLSALGHDIAREVARAEALAFARLD
jgi:hypothetical protein